MKKSTVLLLLIPSLFLLTATQCDEDNTIEFSCENQLEALSELDIVIRDLAASSVCSGAFECDSIAYGAKPCGGPWEYLTYSTSIDTSRLEELVTEYNTIEDDYNLNCDAASDCAFVIPPSGFECENNICITIN